MGNSNSSHPPHHHQSGGKHQHHPNQHRYPNPQGYYEGGWTPTHSHSLEPPDHHQMHRNRMKRGYFPPRAYVGVSPQGQLLPQPQKVLPQAAVNPNKLLKATSNGAILHGGGTISGRKLSEIELEIQNRKRSTLSCPLNEEMGYVGNGMSSGRSTPNLLMPRMGLSGHNGHLVPPSTGSSRSRDYGSEPDLREVGVSNESRKTREQLQDFEQYQDSSSCSPPLPNSFTLISESPAKKQIRSRKKSKAPPPPMVPYPHEQIPPNFVPYQYQLQQNPQRQLLLTPMNGANTPRSSSGTPTGEKKSRLFKTKAESKSQTSSGMNSPVVRTSGQKPTELIKPSQPIGGDEREGKKQNVRNKNASPAPLLSNNKNNKNEAKQNGNSRISSQQEEKDKKTFYFGMDMGTFKQKVVEDSSSAASKQLQHLHVEDLHKEISRRKMLQKLESESRSSSRNSGNNNSSGKPSPKNAAINNNNNGRMSESDSDGIHRRQDSGSFDINEKANKKQQKPSRNQQPPQQPQSSSDLSSSDLDVPLVVTRPTLPQKRLELPRFSPTAAWRAIDSPSRGSNNSNSGRSFDLDSAGEDSRRFPRPSPALISNERSGDSGISAGDAGSPANAIPLLEEEEYPLKKTSNSKDHNNVGANRMMKCWTPEQDLDESSSDFDHEHDLPPPPVVPPKPTKSKFNLFEGKRASAVVSDTDSKYFGNSNNSRRKLYSKQQQQQFVGLDTNWFLSRSEPNSLNYIGLVQDQYKPTKSSKTKAAGKTKKKKEVIIGNRVRKDEVMDEFECEVLFDEEGSSDNNISKTEIGYGPSNMNFLPKTSNKPLLSYEDQEERIEVKESELSSEEELMRDDLFDYLDQYEEGEFEREQENDNKKFSHNIMYLPSYDGRKLFGNNANSKRNWRRTRSVDQLDGNSEPLFRRELKDNKPTKEIVEERRQQEATNGFKNKPIVDRKSSVPSYFPSQGDEVAKYDAEEEERRLQNKKKFKFQSTLRVLERRKIEQALSLEAQAQEDQRLREIEEMKKVEEEFQKKRQAKAEAEARAKEAQAQEEAASRKIFNFTQSSSNKKQSPSPNSPVVVGVTKSSVTNIRVNGQGHHYPNDISNSRSYNFNQRQEPEGAPASVNSNSSSLSTDLRKELITASKKRSGNLQHQNQTQELSEYRQETRQYCDYRSSRQQSLSPARFVQKASSTSDLFPVNMHSRRQGGKGSKTSGSGRSSAVTVSTIHPEVVCDIPVKPGQYMVNGSRPSESERPISSARSGSALNLNMHSPRASSPSSVLSNNYRKDWAHHHNSPMVNSRPNGRASSVISLHSAPPTAYSPSDFSGNLRNSTTDLSRVQSPSRFYRERPNGNHLSRQYSASPPPSTGSPVPSSSYQMSEKSTSHSPTNRGGSPLRMKSNTTVISIGPQLPFKYVGANGIRRSSSSSASAKNKPNTFKNSEELKFKSSPHQSFQPQPYSPNKAYRPVAFKPLVS